MGVWNKINFNFFPKLFFNHMIELVKIINLDYKKIPEGPKIAELFLRFLTTWWKLWFQNWYQILDTKLRRFEALFFSEILQKNFSKKKIKIAGLISKSHIKFENDWINSHIPETWNFEENYMMNSSKRIFHHLSLRKNFRSCLLEYNFLENFAMFGKWGDGKNRQSLILTCFFPFNFETTLLWTSKMQMANINP